MGKGNRLSGILHSGRDYKEVIFEDLPQEKRSDDWSTVFADMVGMVADAPPEKKPAFYEVAKEMTIQHYKSGGGEKKK